MRKTLYIILLLAAIGVSSCKKQVFGDLPDCDYSVVLRYDYNEENTTTKNMIEYYVYSIDEYIFDDKGVLYQYRRFTHKDSEEYTQSKLELPTGRYSVIAIGNQDERSTVNEAKPGITSREDILLTLSNAERMPNNTNGNSERLYHGYETFTVKPNEISRIRVDMVNSHLNLKFRVTWKNNSTPERGDYFAILESVPSEYGLMPEFIYPTGSLAVSFHNPFILDSYLVDNNNIVHHIPTVYQDRNPLVHRINTKVNVDNEMWGEFVSYRLKSATKPIMRIYKPGGTGSSADTQIVKDIDLQKYFDWYDYNLDTELKQSYVIDIVVDGDLVTVIPMDIADWEEGGILKN